jgi:hypothetical protein
VGRGSLLALCGLLILPGCAEADDGQPSTTTAPTAAVVTPPSSTVDPKAPPTSEQLQDPAYWNAVLGSLNNIAGNAIRKVLATRKVEPREVEAVRQVYGPRLFATQQAALTAAANGNAQGLTVPTGDTLTTIQRVIKAGATCAALDANLDNRPVGPSLPSGRFIVRLIPRELREPRLNPTPWAIDAYFDPSTGDVATACP